MCLRVPDHPNMCLATVAACLTCENFRRTVSLFLRFLKIPVSMLPITCLIMYLHPSDCLKHVPDMCLRVPDHTYMCLAIVTTCLTCKNFKRTVFTVFLFLRVSVSILQ